MPVGASSSATAPKNAAAMGSRNAVPIDSVSSTPTAPVVPRASARADGSGPTYPRSAAAARIVRRISAESWSGRENALDTVIRLTPTRSAIVCSVTRDMTTTLFRSMRDRVGRRDGSRRGERRHRAG